MPPPDLCPAAYGSGWRTAAIAAVFIVTMLIALAGLAIFAMVCCCGPQAKLSTRAMLANTAKPGTPGAAVVLDVQASGMGRAPALLQRLQTSAPVLPWNRGLEGKSSTAIVPADASGAPGGDASKDGAPAAAPRPAEALAAAAAPGEFAEHPYLPLLARSLRSSELPALHYIDNASDEAGVEMALRRPSARTTQLPSAAPLNFLGSKGASEEAPAFADPTEGDAVCHELAAQLHNMNHQAAADGKPPYRLWVEGHVSAALKGDAHARRLSRQRAQLCADLIKERLLEIDGYLTSMHADALVVAVGMGTASPLAGYADGGNYVENRRVEFHVGQLDGLETGLLAYTIEVHHRPPPSRDD